MEEVLEGLRLEDLAVDLVRDEHAVLVDHELLDAPSALHREAVQRAAGLLRAELVVLRIHPEEPRVPEHDADEVHHEAVPAVVLPEVDLGLLARVGRGHHVVEPAVLLLRCYLPALAQVADVVPQRLLIARQYLVLAALDELLDENVVDRAHVASGVHLQYAEYLGPERLLVEGMRLPDLRMAVVRRGIHVVVLPERLLAGHLRVPAPQLVPRLRE